MAFTFDWSAASVKSCLSQRDRFTLHDMTKGFEKDPKCGAVLFDPARNLYATPVSNNRYLVLWHQEPGSNRIKPGFVVTKSYWNETPEQLKEKIEKIMPMQSHGHYTLDNVFGKTPPATDSPPPPRPIAVRKPLVFRKN
jgi:hypothetical protein